MRTAEEYLKALSKMRPTIYIDGQKIDDFTEHPLLRPPINIMAKSYEIALQPEYEPLFTTKSHLTGKKINRFTHVYHSIEDLLAAVKMLRVAGRIVGQCPGRCLTKEVINPMYDTTYQIDQKYGTEYHKRFKEVLIRVQNEDLNLNTCLTDVRGDRSKMPSQQADPDSYVHIVHEDQDGIVVRGAKMHQTSSYATEYLNVAPSRAMRAEDKDYAVAFIVPIDAEGLKFIIAKRSLDDRRMLGHWDDCGNIYYDHFDAMVIFDNVFIPWKHVFMCREYDFSEVCSTHFTAMHRMSYGGCRPGLFDVIIGAAKLLSEYNGVPKAGHIRSKLTKMVFLNETLWSCGLAAAYSGHQLPSGSFSPNRLLANVAKLHTSDDVFDLAKIAQDICGGIVATMPTIGNDLKSSEIGHYIKKYLKTVPEVPAEERMKVVRLVEYFASGFTVPGDLHGGGSPEVMAKVIENEYDFDFAKEKAKLICGITKQEFTFNPVPKGVRPPT